jgi:cytochrome c
MVFIECGANTGMEWGNAAVPTVQYTHGMLSCSEFTGVPLRSLLELCGVDMKRAKFVLAEGADLHLGNVLPADFTLSDANIREVQQRLPNRKGMTTAHALWPGKELGGLARPDVQGSACMRDCKSDVVIKSFLPDYARNAHGNLADQSRMVGASRGADTQKPPPAQDSEQKSTPAQSERAQEAPEKIATVASTGSAAVMPLLQKNACVACHGMDSKLVGPSFRDIANKYKDRADAVNYLSGKIKRGGQGVWGAIPMPAQALSPEESVQLAQWLVQGMKQ